MSAFNSPSSTFKDPSGGDTGWGAPPEKSTNDVLQDAMKKEKTIKWVAVNACHMSGRMMFVQR